MDFRTCGGVSIWVFAASVFAQGAAPAGAPGAAANTGSTAAPVIGADVKDAAPTGASVRDRMSGRRGGAVNFDHKPPTNVRIRESGVKLPKCVEESREGEACKQ